MSLIQVRNGNLVVPVQYYVCNPGRNLIKTFVSSDDGRTWRGGNAIDLGGHGHHDGAPEPALIELRDGPLWMLIRTNWGIKTADLDRDGWLDLVVTSHKLSDTAVFDFGTVISGGAPQRFRPHNAQRLPAHDGIAITMAESDSDGHPDIYLPAYHYGFARGSVASHLFWGGPRGFADDDRTDLTQDAGHGAVVGDFSGDGRLDLVIACHSRNGSRFADSLVFCNDGARSRRTAPQRLPTTGPHLMQRADVGNPYDRSWREACASSVFAWDRSWSRLGMAWRAETRGGCWPELWWRSAARPEDLPRQSWIRHSRPTRIHSSHRVPQYRVFSHSGNGDSYPVLNRMEVVLE